MTDADGERLSGATVNCDSEDCPVFYPVGGSGSAASGVWFIDSETGELATSTGSRGMFIVPDAPFTNYTITRDGYTFGSPSLGTIEGLVNFTLIKAD